MARHAGRRCVVTGGASGIGLAMVRRFVAEGARVAVVDRAPEQLDDADVRPDVEVVIRADVAHPDEVRAAFDRVAAEWGGVDIVLNNAGVSVREPWFEVTVKTWNEVLGVNLTGAFFVAQHAAKLMRAGGGAGVILNTASVSGMVGMPNYVSYNVSKAGVIEMTKTLALELAPSIRVNAIAPGYILTPMQRREYTEDGIARCAEGLPMKRLGTPEEVAAMASFLASDEAAYATGQSFVIDGGETAGGLASQ
jgi:meso-butanediol dehydrogenase / (S,S)-butanediol dehydrogenase / diacetyl reductase